MPQIIRNCKGAVQADVARLALNPDFTARPYTRRFHQWVLRRYSCIFSVISSPSAMHIVALHVLRNCFRQIYRVISPNRRLPYFTGCIETKGPQGGGALIACTFHLPPWALWDNFKRKVGKLYCVKRPATNEELLQ